jgi:hypothetical protein
LFNEKTKIIKIRFRKRLISNNNSCSIKLMRKSLFHILCGLCAFFVAFAVKKEAEVIDNPFSPQRTQREAQRTRSKKVVG